MMRIGIDGSRLSGNMSGIGRYVHSILQPLDAALPGAEFVLYTRGVFEHVLPSSRWSVKQERNPLFRSLPTVFWVRFRLGWLLRKDRLDVFWAANTLIPTFIGAVPSVSTIYDLNHILVPETMPAINRFAYQRWFARSTKVAAELIAISEATSTRLHQLTGRSANAVARPAVPFLDVSHDLDKADAVLKEMGVIRPYFLTVGTREPRKNLISCIRALVLLRADNQLRNYQLVMVGASGWRGASLEKGFDTDYLWLRPLGYVNDSKLALLYAMTEAFIYPSIYEGYGIPIGEALALGCRVVATDIPELRESGGPEVTYVQPDPAAIAGGVIRAISRPRPKPREPSHSWADAAATMAESFRRAAFQAGR